MSEDYEPTQWEGYSIDPEKIEGGTATEQKTFTVEGLCTVKIIDANYNDENTEKLTDRDTYKITIESIEDGPSFGSNGQLTYWVKNEERTAYRENVLGTLRSLGKAIMGDKFTGFMPAPCDLVGRVAVADIKMSKPNSLGMTFPRVYRWEPATESYSIYSEKPQYYRQVRTQ